jgi:low-affinity ferrous iron transport protein
MMKNILKVLSKPGVRPEIHGVAPTQHLPENNGSTNNVDIYVKPVKSRMLDRWLDKVVAFSGSEFVFVVILVGCLTWALLGIPYGSSNAWVVSISDIQAILNHAYDSLLVRQQLNGYDNEMMAIAQVQSRILSHARMMKKLGHEKEKEVPAILVTTGQCPLELDVALPQETRFGRLITTFSHVCGHLGTLACFWVAVFV